MWTSANVLPQGGWNGRLKALSLLNHTLLHEAHTHVCIFTTEKLFCIITTAGYGVIGNHLLGPFFFSVSFELSAVQLEAGPVSRPIQSMCLAST